MRLKSIAIVTACAALAGCGGGGESDSPESVAKDFVAAVVNKDGKRACDLLTERSRTNFDTSGLGKCEDFIVGPLARRTTGTKVDVVNVSGERATAETDGGSFKLRKESDEWRVDFQ